MEGDGFPALPQLPRPFKAMGCKPPESPPFNCEAALENGQALPHPLKQFCGMFFGFGLDWLPGDSCGSFLGNMLQPRIRNHVITKEELHRSFQVKGKAKRTTSINSCRSGCKIQCFATRGRDLGCCNDVSRPANAYAVCLVPQRARGPTGAFFRGLDDARSVGPRINVKNLRHCLGRVEGARTPAHVLEVLIATMCRSWRSHNYTDNKPTLLQDTGRCWVFKSKRMLCT